MAWSVNVVFPELSGPKISTTRPRGYPPQPSARSSPTDPLGMIATGCAISPSPSRITAPFPNCFSMAPIAAKMAFTFSVTLLMSPP